MRLPKKNLIETNITVDNFREPPKPPKERDPDDPIEEIQLLRINFSALDYPAVEITLSWSFAKLNRVLKRYDPQLLLSACFQNLHFKPPPQNEEDSAPKRNVNVESCQYIEAVLLKGIRVNGREYNFFGHSNSQLKEKTCFLFAASKEECWKERNRLGDFSKLTSVAKVAKRFGLLCSSAQPLFPLPWKGEGHEDGYPVEADIEENEQNFTDGCGYISKALMRKVAHTLRHCFDKRPLLPSVIQIRYRGVKGVLALNPNIKTDVAFRKSMEKFPCDDDSFCVVEASRPYIYGKLNQQIVALLSALGITDQKLKEVQQEHYRRLEDMFTDPLLAFKVLCGEDKRTVAGELMENGFTAKVIDVLNAVRSRIMKQSTKERNNLEKTKLSIVVDESRFAFAVNDPNEKEEEQLNEGEVYFAPMIDGVPTPICGNVVLVRNPCLFPGDILLRRAVENAGCQHLVDCAVFPVKGKRSTASCSGGGDLDGDKFTVIWDKRLIPEKMQDPYGYPAAAEKPAKKIVLDDLIKYFAYFNNASLGAIDKLYWQWARITPNGASSDQCVRLNERFASAVDGERVSVPSDLRCPPKDHPEHPMKKPVWEELLEESQRRYDLYKEECKAKVQKGGSHVLASFSLETMQDIVSSSDMNISNYQLMVMIDNWWKKHNDMYNQEDRDDLIGQIDYRHFTHAQKQVAKQLGVSSKVLMNALNQSDILGPKQLQQVFLDVDERHWNLFFSYSVLKFTQFGNDFMERLCNALSNFTKTLLVFQYSDHFSVAVYFPRPLKVGEKNTDLGDVVYFGVFNGIVQKRMLPKDMTVYLGLDKFQMYYRQEEGNTFIWMKGQLGNHVSRNPKKERVGRNGTKVAEAVPVEQCQALGLPLDRLEMQYEISFSIAVRERRWFSEMYTKNMDLIRKERLIGVEIYVTGTVQGDDNGYRRVVLNLLPLPLGNTTIPVHKIVPPDAADYDAPDFDKPLARDAEIVEQLKRFRDEGVIEVLKSADSLMPFIRAIHYYGQTETIWCSNFIQKILNKHGRDIKFDNEVFQILLYIPQMTMLFARHCDTISSGVCMKLLCALLRSSSTLPTSQILQEAKGMKIKMDADPENADPASEQPKEDKTFWYRRPPQKSGRLTCSLQIQLGGESTKKKGEDLGGLLDRMKQLEDDKFSAKEYCDLLKASVMVLDPSVGIEFNDLLFNDEDGLVEEDYFKRFGFLLCRDLLAERIEKQSERNRKSQRRIKLSLNTKKEEGDNGKDGKKKKVKFNYRALNVKDRPRVGDIVIFTRMSKPKREAVADAENEEMYPALGKGVVRPQPRKRVVNNDADADPVVCVGVVKDISPDILIHFDFAPPPEIELATWEMEIVGNSTTFKHAIDAACVFVSDKENCTRAYPAIMGLASAEAETDEQEDNRVQEFFGGLNHSQRDAVRMAYLRKLTVVQGPPGTGKTHTIVRMLQALIDKYGKCRVLAVASTNTAADNILRGIVRLKAEQSDREKFSPVRVGDKSSVSKDLHGYTLAELAEGKTRQEKKKNTVKAMQEADLIVGTCVGAGLADLKDITFSVVVIDEASQVTEPCALIAIVKAHRVVLVGDHQQLPPQVHELAKSDTPGLDLSVSLFDRVAHSSAVDVQMLDEHYRCHPFIIDFCSEEFYDGRLKAVVPPAKRLLPKGLDWPNAEKPVMLIDVKGEEKTKTGGSKCNKQEADVVMCLLKKLLMVDAEAEEKKEAVRAKEVGVVSAYKDQIELLKKKVKDSPKLKGFAKEIEIVTVDGFQGREKDVIIFSAVRSRDDGEIGFLSDARRFNVLMTRAKRGMIVIANRGTLRASMDLLWNRWIDYVEQHGLLVDGQQFLEKR